MKSAVEQKEYTYYCILDHIEELKDKRSKELQTSASCVVPSFMSVRLIDKFKELGYIISSEKCEREEGKTLLTISW